MPKYVKRNKNIGLHLWDFLAWATVLFPLFTGGFWIRRPGLFIELTQINGPVIVLGVLGYLLITNTEANLADASSVRFLKMLWRNWKALLQKNPERTVLITGTLVGLVWGWVACERHWAFQSGYADLGIFDNAIWNLAHGNGYVSSVKGGMHLLSDHQSPIFFLFYPLYKILPTPETLLIAQGLGLAYAGVALFFLARQYLGPDHKLLPLLPLAAWAYFPIRNANRFDFHPEIFMLPIFLFAIAGLQSKRARNIIIGAFAFLLGLAAKESAGPVAAGIGLAWILGAGPENVRRRMRLIGGAAIGCGLFVFYLDLKIIPRWFSMNYQYQNAYAHFGPELRDLLLAPFLKTPLFLKTLFAGSRIKFFLQTIGPFALIPLLSPRTFVAALPGYFIYFLSSGDHRVNIGYHYAIESAVGVFWSVAPGLIQGEKLLRKWRPAWNAKTVLGFMLVFCSLVGYGRSELFFIRFYFPSPHHVWLKEEVFPVVNKHVKLAATGTFVPHLTGRNWAHHLPIIDLPNQPGKFVDCIFWSRHPEVNNTPLNAETTAVMERVMAQEKYTSIYRCHGLEVWQHPSSTHSCLDNKPKCN